MQTAFPLILATLLSYLIGSVPFGFLIARTQGTDIRKVGSGNIGATNVFRTLGKRLGIATFLLDIGKGVAAVLLVPLVITLRWPEADDTIYLKLLCAVAAVAGHNWPVW